MLSDVLTLWDFLEKRYNKYTVIHALFSAEGKRINGNDKIVVELIPSTKPSIWYFRIKPYKNYIFVPFPVNPAVNVDYGTLHDDVNPDSGIFRYVSSPMAHFASGGEENLKVDFIVFGYEVENLIERVKAR